MKSLDILRCPNCCGDLHHASDSGKIVCQICNINYMSTLGILDFRNFKTDFSANFSCDNDLNLAKLLAGYFDETNNFHELYHIYSKLKTIQLSNPHFENIDSNKILTDAKNCKYIGLSVYELTHGFAILDKVNLELSRLGKDNLPTSGIALENGCGIGYFVPGFSNYFKQVIVLDFSLSYLILAKKIAQEQNLTNIIYICANAEKLPIKDSSIDFIHSNNVVEHINDPLNMIKHAERTLNNGALLYIQSPNKNSIYIEPHFNLPCYGFIPYKIRKFIIFRTQSRDPNTVSLLTLSQLKKLIKCSFNENFQVTFIPRHLKSSISGGAIRKVIVSLLNTPILGIVINLLLNKLLLTVMPYHVALCFKKAK